MWELVGMNRVRGSWGMSTKIDVWMCKSEWVHVFGGMNTRCPLIPVRDH